MSRLKAKIRNLQQKTSAYGVVVSTMVGRANVKLSTGGKTIHGVRVIGGSVNPGDAVYIEYQGGEPVIQTGSGITYSGQYKFADKLSIGRDTPPAGNCPLVEAGWGIDVATGIISKNNVYIDPAGHIKLGTADDDFAAMSAADTTYRFWAGKLSSSSAPFRVSKAGALWSTSGTLANWTISTDNLSTDSSNVVLSAATNPYIRLGTAAPPSFHGFWVGKDTTYKLYLGDHDGNYIKWETSVLTIKGTINASLGLIGGWTIGDTSLIAGSGGTTVGLDSGGTNPTIYAGSATPSAAPVRIYNDGDFHFGSTTAYLDWNGTVLSIQANLQSSDYVSGVSGWGITLSGDAEFNNLNIRGTIHAAVFEYGVIQATAGTLMVTKSAGTLYTAFQLPAESGLLTFRIKNLKASTSPFVQGDTVRCQYYSGGIYGFWAKITTMDPPEVEYTECHSTTTNWDMGTTPEGTWVPEGTAIVDYGTTGTGYISLSTDGTIGATPNMTMGTIDASIPATTTAFSRMGNLRNSYGYADDANYYGVAFGRYHATDASSIITIDSTNGIRIIKRASGSNTTIGQWTTGGNILVGEEASGKNNVYISSGSISLRNNTTTKILLDTAGYVTIGETGAPASGTNAWVTINPSTGIRMYYQPAGDTYSHNTMRISLTNSVWIGEYDPGDGSAGHIVAVDNTYGLRYIYRDTGDTNHTVFQISFSTTPTITLGETSTGNYTTIHATNGIEMFANATKVVDIDGTTGSFVFGPATASNANMYWHAGVLDFRAGTGTAQVTINTSGQLTAGGGDVILDIDGITIDATSEYSTNQLKFKSGANTLLYLRSYDDVDTAYSYIWAPAITSKGTDFNVVANAPSGKIAELSLTASATNSVTLLLSSSTGITITGTSVTLGTLSMNGNCIVDNNIYADGEISIAGDEGGIGRRYNYYCTPSSSYFYGMDSAPSGWGATSLGVFTSPGSLQYSASHMQITMSSTQLSRHFICKSTTYPTPVITYYYIYAQLGLSCSGTNTAIGIRLDNGDNDDGDFVEFLLSYTGTAGEYKIRRLAATGGGTIDDDSSAVILPFAQILLEIYIAGTKWTSWTAEAMVSIGMTGIGSSRVGLTTGNLAWTPTRLGVTTRKADDTSSWYQGYCDFVYTY